MALDVLIFRGEQEERIAATVAGNAWQQVQLPIAQSHGQITAVAMYADFPRAIVSRADRVELRDVQINALGTRRVEIDSPAALWDPTRELYYLQHALHPGDTLGAHFRASNTATWKIAAPDGTTAWEGLGAAIAYDFSPQSPSGIWTVRIADGNAESTALILVQSTSIRGLLFDQAPPISPELLASVRLRRDELKKTAHVEGGLNIAAMDSHWLLPGLPSYFAVLLQSPEIAMLDAIDYRASGDPTALTESRTLLEAIALWPAWTHPWFPAHGYHSYYPVGIMTKYVVMAEQFLGDDLSAPDRRALDLRLMELAVKPIYTEYVQEDRLQFNTSNWIGNTVGGALLAALQSNDPDAAGYALGLYTKERAHVSAAYTSDGSYGEGVTYHRFDLEMTTLVAQAAARLLGQSLDADLANGDRYIRYASYGSGGLVDYGDTHQDITPSNVFAYMAAQNTSASLSDFYLRYRDTGTAELLSRVLWESKIRSIADDGAPPPASTVFGQRGIVVLRDNWSPESTLIAMRAGKNFNHNHADQGSIFFARDGKLWLGEAGYADYYKDPSYPTFNIQAIGHNTLLVDGNPESQELPGNSVFGVAPSLTRSLIGQDASLVQADLSSVYGGKLKNYSRTLFFVPGGPLFVIDQVNSVLPQTFTQVWHPKQQVIPLDPAKSSFEMTNGPAKVDVFSFSDVAIADAKLESPMPLVEYDMAEHHVVERPLHIETSTKSPQKHATIMTVIVPCIDGDAIPTSHMVARNTLSVTAGDAGVRVDHNDGGPPSILAWWKSGMLMLHGRSLVDKENGGSMTFSVPVDLRMTREVDGGIRVEVTAFSTTDIVLSGFLKGPASGARAAQQRLTLAKGSNSLHLRRIIAQAK
jgi:hypothetical protein